MGRPPRHDRDRLLDAAVDLAYDAGPAGVTVAAVARAAGAPSGSVYHRFPSAAALLAALWLRTLERFQEGFVAAISGEPVERAAEAAARYVVAWSRNHPREARLLRYGPRDFGQPDWPAAESDRFAADNRRVHEAVTALAARLGRSHDLDRVILATVDVPLSAVSRHLRNDTPIPASAEDLVAEATIALLQLRQR
ncbi:TetR family transcriptional regulator [Amycolatopsis taiwanensis]|uniref:Transcriptional regulator, TetR family protein n=1 Tax=Amycolatopsis taiwanensis TaxID=342230 RepID=A0A9W6R1F9_9PSEU|nr:TetR family transcriptional regulator [Amycolatopsis taiwanensis]GLY66628.1 putative transcriptional regulator, TetR family protein [Amycolatopsis taiwanensis]